MARREHHHFTGTELSSLPMPIDMCASAFSKTLDGFSFSCQQHFLYIMDLYSETQIEACSATVQGRACGPECDRLWLPCRFTIIAWKLSRIQENWKGTSYWGCANCMFGFESLKLGPSSVRWPRGDECRSLGCRLPYLWPVHVIRTCWSEQWLRTSTKQIDKELSSDTDSLENYY
jgi:hypothetical protein